MLKPVVIAAALLLAALPARAQAPEMPTPDAQAWKLMYDQQNAAYQRTIAALFGMDQKNRELQQKVAELTAKVPAAPAPAEPSK